MFPIARSLARSTATMVGTLLLLAGCGPASKGATTTAAEPELGTAIQALQSENGLAQNGFSQNGLSQNGLSQNGLSQNGLSQNGLSQNGFSSWFNQSRSQNAMVMKYMARCALDPNQSLVWTNPQTGTTYTWPGTLGVAPAWAGGSPATVAEQQLVTACLAAHVNKFGLQIAIAVEGKTASGATLPVASDELTTFDLRESCFFGNVFNGDGVYSGFDHADWDVRYSAKRACAFSSKNQGTSKDCPPIFEVGLCSSMCTPSSDGISYDTCTYLGKTYKALTTRIPASARSYCGDGLCDPQEKCGGGSSWDSCRADCGSCSD